MESISDLKNEAEQYFSDASARGTPVITFKCPCCSKELRTLQPPKGVIWDTLSTCWHCGAGFFKIATQDEVRAQVPPSLGHAKQ